VKDVKTLSTLTIREIVLETGIEPPFIEKDWFAIRLLILLSSFKNNRSTHWSFPAAPACLRSMASSNAFPGIYAVKGGCPIHC